ncbi:response regulator [Paenibacillus aurantius]|uniref:Transcriptional regulatory protein n=1 Tax=Paenibacillus aurantius TaxID=2918900 RepID=A0AA96LF07_9BACL|nr:response regulator [Paenibacillus aurantius]WNQ10876.1 response regulator [Paenibacillus aurantius]
MEGKWVEVVLIEDDPMVRQVNREFVERVPGFRVVGAAGNGVEGLQLVRELRPSLVLLDVFMPQQDGLETLRRIRQEAVETDVIVITAARDEATIREMMRGGAADYILKPFKFERVKESLERYLRLHAGLKEAEAFSQEELDAVLHGRREARPSVSGGSPASPAAGAKGPALPLPEELPKGLNAQTLKQIAGFLERTNEPVSAEEAADGVGIARVTARRYLEYLEKTGWVALDIRYGGVGRPVNRYLLQKR